MLAKNSFRNVLKISTSGCFLNEAQLGFLSHTPRMHLMDHIAGSVLDNAPGICCILSQK